MATFYTRSNNPGLFLGFTMKILLVYFLVITILIRCVRCSEMCQFLTPKSLTTSDLEDQWYWILATFNELDYENDCAGFIGDPINSTFINFTVTDRKSHNPSIEGSIIEKRVLLNGEDPNCCTKTNYAYQAAIVEENFICFYFCGAKCDHDYAQCFSRFQDVSPYDHKRLYNGLRFFGLLLSETSLRKVSRESCPDFEKESDWEREHSNPLLHLVRESVPGVLVVIISGTFCSEMCKHLLPRDVTMDDLAGQWYFILATFNEYDCEDDCSGFFGIATNETHGTFMVTDRHDYNPVLTAEIKNRRILVHGRDITCCRPVFFSYQAALVEDNFLCFYFCGSRSENDYAQCFGRSQDVSLYDQQRLEWGLNYFGLTMGDCALRKVNREFCSNRDSGNPLNMGLFRY